MAHNDGPIQFKGSIGNIRSYYDRSLKKYILSTKGGANKNLIKNNPAFARTRDCMNEFTGCSKWSSKFRKCLLVIDHLMYSRYFSMLVKMSKAIQVRDEENTYGFRSIEPSKAPYLLREINFNQQIPFQGVIREAYSVNFSQDKKTVRFSMPGFIPRTRLNWPTPFQLFRFYLVIAQVSDMVWNEKDRHYYLVVDDLGRLTRCSTSEWMVNNAEPVDILMEVSFDESALTLPGTTVIVALGVEMATDVTGGTAYVTPGNGTMGIVEGFVK